MKTSMIPGKLYCPVKTAYSGGFPCYIPQGRFETLWIPLHTPCFFVGEQDFYYSNFLFDEQLVKVRSDELTWWIEWTDDEWKLYEGE